MSNSKTDWTADAFLRPTDYKQHCATAPAGSTGSHWHPQDAPARYVYGEGCRAKTEKVEWVFYSPSTQPQANSTSGVLPAAVPPTPIVGRPYAAAKGRARCVVAPMGLLGSWLVFENISRADP